MNLRHGLWFFLICLVFAAMTYSPQVSQANNGSSGSSSSAPLLQEEESASAEGPDGLVVTFSYRPGANEYKITANQPSVSYTITPTDASSPLVSGTQAPLDTWTSCPGCDQYVQQGITLHYTTQTSSVEIDLALASLRLTSFSLDFPFIRNLTPITLHYTLSRSLPDFTDAADGSRPYLAISSDSLVPPIQTWIPLPHNQRSGSVIFTVNYQGVILQSPSYGYYYNSHRNYNHTYHVPSDIDFVNNLGLPPESFNINLKVSVVKYAGRGHAHDSSGAIAFPDGQITIAPNTVERQVNYLPLQLSLPESSDPPTNGPVIALAPPENEAQAGFLLLKDTQPNDMVIICNGDKCIFSARPVSLLPLTPSPVAGWQAVSIGDLWTGTAMQDGKVTISILRDIPADSETGEAASTIGQRLPVPLGYLPPHRRFGHLLDWFRKPDGSFLNYTVGSPDLILESVEENASEFANYTMKIRVPSVFEAETPVFVRRSLGHQEAYIPMTNLGNGWYRFSFLWFSPNYIRQNVLEYYEYIKSYQGDLSPDYHPYSSYLNLQDYLTIGTINFPYRSQIRDEFFGNCSEAQVPNLLYVYVRLTYVPEDVLDKVIYMKTELPVCSPVETMPASLWIPSELPSDLSFSPVFMPSTKHPVPGVWNQCHIYPSQKLLTGHEIFGRLGKIFTGSWWTPSQVNIVYIARPAPGRSPLCVVPLSLPLPLGTGLTLAHPISFSHLRTLTGVLSSSYRGGDFSPNLSTLVNFPSPSDCLVQQNIPYPTVDVIFYYPFIRAATISSISYFELGPVYSNNTFLSDDARMAAQTAHALPYCLGGEKTYIINTQHPGGRIFTTFAMKGREPLQELSPVALFTANWPVLNERNGFLVTPWNGLYYNAPLPLIPNGSSPGGLPAPGCPSFAGQVQVTPPRAPSTRTVVRVEVRTNGAFTYGVIEGGVDPVVIERDGVYDITLPPGTARRPIRVLLHREDCPSVSQIVWVERTPLLPVGWRIDATTSFPVVSEIPHERLESQNRYWQGESFEQGLPILKTIASAYQRQHGQQMPALPPPPARVGQTRALNTKSTGIVTKTN